MPRLHFPDAVHFFVSDFPYDFSSIVDDGHVLRRMCLHYILTA